MRRSVAGAIFDKRDRTPVPLFAVRTRPEEIRLEESEAGSPSERLGRNPRERVRSWRTFGQDRWKSKWMSLKLVDLRTQEGQIRVKESEPGTYIPVCAKSVPAKAGALFLPKAA